MLLFCLIIFFCFIVFIIKDYHKAVLCFAPISVLFQDYMCVRYVAPAISLSFLLEFIFLSIAMVKRRLSMCRFPFKKAYCLLFFVLIVGIFVSEMDFLKTGPFVFDLILSYYIVVIFYNELKSFEDVKYSIRCFIVLILFFCAYSTIEYFVQYNPVLDYLGETIPEEWGGRLYETTERYSSIRCQSFMTITIGWGGLCCMALSLMLYCRSAFVHILIPISFWFVILILIFCTYTTGTRSAFLYLMIVLFGSCIMLRGTSKRMMITLLVIGGLYTLYNMGDIISSIISSDSSSESGSNSSMRQLQLIAAINVISNSPIWGFGVKGVSIAGGLDGDIHGAESVWFQQLISYGLMGVISQIYIYYSIIKLLCKESKKFIFVALGWIAFASLTTSPGLGEYYFLIIIILIYKANQLISNRPICLK